MAEFLSTTIEAKKKSRKQGFCRHTKLIADESVRMLKCDVCGLWIDPFEFLLDWALRKVVMRWQVDELGRKKSELVKQIGILKKDKRKAERMAKGK